MFYPVCLPIEMDKLVVCAFQDSAELGVDQKSSPRNRASCRLTVPNSLLEKEDSDSKPVCFLLLHWSGTYFSTSESTSFSFFLFLLFYVTHHTFLILSHFRIFSQSVPSLTEEQRSHTWCPQMPTLFIIYSHHLNFKCTKHGMFPIMKNSSNEKF